MSCDSEPVSYQAEESADLTPRVRPPTRRPTSMSTSSPPVPRDTAEAKKSKLRGQRNDSEEVKISKNLSYILRHGAEKEKLTLRKDGYIKLSEILARPKLKGVEVSTVESIVAENVKQRFTLLKEVNSESGEEEYWIRANQGHSLQVEDLELERIFEAQLIPIVVHGTRRNLWPSIQKDGLQSMTRTHIHCATGLLGEEGVISGMRASCDCFIYLDVQKCLDAGIEFYKSSNGVILTVGLQNTKNLPCQYFSKVVTKNGLILFPLSPSN